MASFTAAGSAYATHGEPMIPFYIFYSMFGFQRTGDSIWAMADQLARGFLIGATAGRTTLTGEGLQHADGHSPLLAATNPAVVHYDPAFAYEIGAHHAGRPAAGCTAPATSDADGEDVIYYLTVYNEPIAQPAEPDGRRRRGHPQGHLPASPPPRRDGAPRVQLLASGVGCPLGRWRPSELLAEDWGVAADVWSVTSWNELRRDAWPPRSGTSSTPARSRARRTSPTSSPDAAGPGRRRHRLHAGRAGPDRAVGPGRLRLARRRRLRLRRHPRRPRAASSRSTPSRSWCARCRRSPTAARSSGRRPTRPRRATGSTT